MSSERRGGELASAFMRDSYNGRETIFYCLRRRTVLEREHHDGERTVAALAEIEAVENYV